MFTITEIGWGNLIFSLAILGGIIVTAALAKRRDFPPRNLFIFFLLAIPMATLFSRAIWIAFNWQTFLSMPSGQILGWGGNVSLYGALAGLILTAYLFGAKKYISSAALLDLLAPGIALAVAIGRIADYEYGSNFGIEVSSDALHFFPIAVYVPSLNSWLYAVFIFEAVFCLAIFIFLLFFRRKERRNGDTFLWLLLLYGAGRVVFESMRADSTYIGFVKIFQVISIVILLAILVLFSIRALKRRRIRGADLACWLWGALAVAAAFWGEFYMGADSYTQNTLIVAAAMLSLVIICTRFYSAHLP